MTSAGSNKPSLADLGWKSRRSLVREPVWPARIDGGGQDLLGWVPAEGAVLRIHLAEHGAVLLRDFACPDIAAGLAAAVEIIGGKLQAYEEQSSPRTDLGNGIYTSTEYPRDQEVFFHNESSYAARFPGVLGFACEAPADAGGETPLVDVRAVHDRLPQDLRDRFARDGVLYVRRHARGLGVDWESAYGSRDRAGVVRKLAADGYDVAWEGDVLEVRRRGPAMIDHPTTGRRSWFNHAAFFHATTLPPLVAAALVAELGENNLPSQTYHGDGAAIEPAMLDVIRDAYRELAVWHRWQRGDIVLVDNLAVAHGRAPYEGSRRILVAMSQLYRSTGNGGVHSVETCA